MRGEAAIAHLRQHGLYGPLKEAFDAARYSVRGVPGGEGGYRAANPAHGLRARFTGDAARVALAGPARFEVGFRVSGVGYGDRQLAVAEGSLEACGNRVEVTRTPLRGEDGAPERGALVEWYVNTSAGLEQGFTLSAPPGARSEGEHLRLALELLGDGKPQLAEGGQALVWTEAGRERLRYDKLQAWDARGRALRASMSLAGKELRLEVDDADAVYPLTIDPMITQNAFLKASNTGMNDLFGSAVALSGNTAVIGAFGEASGATGVDGDESDDSAPGAGAAYVFERTGSVWSQQAYLKASNTGESDAFGFSVGVSGDTVVVGAVQEDSNSTGVNGSELNDLSPDSGAAYVFVRSGTTWSQQAYLKASNTGTNDFFGYTVAASGDTIVVGAPNESSNATGVDGNQNNDLSPFSGAAYVFVRSGTSWSQQAYLKASNTGNDDTFGSAAAASGDTVVLSSPGEDSNATGVNGNQANNGAPSSGAVYVFVRTGTLWSQQAYLKASNTATNDNFGFSLAASADTVAVGAPGEDSNATGVNGNQANNGAPQAGAAYVFVRAGILWSQQAYLKASNTASNDFFGYSLGASGNSIVVGAPFEDSDATGVNGDQGNDASPGSGAAYLFTRSGTTWSQDSYLKASNTGSGDSFGFAVAAEADTEVVGAAGEDSDAVGVNGDESNDLAQDSGAAYVFTPANNDPVADAGADFTAAVGSACQATVTLAGTAQDADGDTLTITWTGSFGTITGTLTPTITLPLGVHTITLTVEDGHHGLATDTVEVTVEDQTPPTLMLLGPNPLTHQAGAPFTDPGATANDNCDGNLNGAITVVSNVNPNVVGSYTMVYSVEDSSNNPASATRVVNVVDTIPPTIACPANISVTVGGGPGAIVNFAPIVNDNQPGVTFACAPPSGSLFPLGTTNVTCTATDASMNTASCGFTVTVMLSGPSGLPRPTIRGVRNDLIALRATVTNKHDRDKLDEAIKHLDKALEDRRWIDDSHPAVKKEGDKVFHDTKEAAKKLQELIKDKHSSISDATLLDFINRLIFALRRAAQIAIDEAIARGGKQKEIDHAIEEIAKADREIAKGKYHEGMEHFKHAWEHALKA